MAKKNGGLYLVICRAMGMSPRVFGFKTKDDQLKFCGDIDETYGAEMEFIYSENRIEPDSDYESSEFVNEFMDYVNKES